MFHSPVHRKQSSYKNPFEEGTVEKKKEHNPKTPQIDAEIPLKRTNNFPVQRKAQSADDLGISQPEDASEKEADAIAKDVSFGKQVDLNTRTNNFPIQPKGEGGGMSVPQGFGQELSSAKTNGFPIGEKYRSGLEQQMQKGFGDVRIHDDPKADALSSSINAKAFTHGQDIFFKQGEYRPETPQGKELLAHELVHVSNESTSVLQRQAETIVPDDPETALGNKLLDEHAEGVTVVFFDHIGHLPNEFGEAKTLAERYNALGIEGSDVSISTIKWGKAIPRFIEIQKEGAKTKEKIFMADIVGLLVPVLKTCVEKASAKRGEQVNENAYKINNLLIGSHGWCGGFSVQEDDQRSYDEVIAMLSPYLTKDVNVAIYACSVARDFDEDYSWYTLTKNPGGATSTAALVRDKLAELGHTEARVWGHTTIGHFIDNYALRFFDAKDFGQQGVPFMLHAFQPIIDSDLPVLISDVLTGLRQKDYAIWKEEDIAVLNTYVQEQFVEILRSVYVQATKDPNCMLEIDANGVKQKRPIPEVAPLFPEEASLLLRNYYNNTIPVSSKPSASKIATNFSYSGKVKLQKIAGSSKANPVLITSNVKKYVLGLSGDVKGKIPDIVSYFEGLEESMYPQVMDATFFSILEKYQTAVNAEKNTPFYVVGKFNATLINLLNVQ